jgi:hypothetical protein
MMLIYNGMLVTSSLSNADTASLYSYLVWSGYKADNSKLNKEPFNRIPTSASYPGGGASPFGRANLIFHPEKIYTASAGEGGGSESSRLDDGDFYDDDDVCGFLFGPDKSYSDIYAPYIHFSKSDECDQDEGRLVRRML